MPPAWCSAFGRTARTRASASAPDPSRQPRSLPARQIATLSPAAAVDRYGLKIRRAAQKLDFLAYFPGRGRNTKLLRARRFSAHCGLWTAPLTARSSPASQQSDMAGVPARNASRPELPIFRAIVDHLLRIRDRRHLVPRANHSPATRHHSLRPLRSASDEPQTRPTAPPGSSPRKRRHRHSRLESALCCFTLYAHGSYPVWTFPPLAIPLSTIRARRKSHPVVLSVKFDIGMIRDPEGNPFLLSRIATSHRPRTVRSSGTTFALTSHLAR